MAVRFSDGLRNIIASSFGSEMAGGQLRIYSGGQPAAGAVATGTLLATIILPNPSFSGAVSGIVSKTGTWAGLVSASGTAGWFRMESSTTGRFVDGLVGSELVLDNNSLILNGTVTVNSFTFTQPAT